MQDFKTGHLVGVAPKAQFQGQLIGSLVSIFVTTTAFSFYSRAYTIPGPEFPAPTAYVWLNLARLLRSGSLPPFVREFMITFGLLSAAAAGMKILATRQGTHVTWVKWIPSGVAFAIGMLNTPNFSMSRLVGGLVELWWRRRYASKRKQSEATRTEDEDEEDEFPDDRGNRELREIGIIIIASGFVLGEGVASILNLILRMLGVGQASCWGCVEGICGGCP
jgi:uncharacterized oligopeptide transporter (OPT) family protein